MLYMCIIIIVSEYCGAANWKQCNIQQENWLCTREIYKEEEKEVNCSQFQVKLLVYVICQLLLSKIVDICKELLIQFRY